MTEELPPLLSDDEFAALLEERKRRAHPEPDRWDNTGRVYAPHEPGDGLPESKIEQQFPRIAEKLAALWPSEACALYIASLLVNERDVRQGFPQTVVDDLLMLHEINDTLLKYSGRPQPRMPR